MIIKLPFILKSGFINKFYKNRDGYDVENKFQAQILT